VVNPSNTLDVPVPIPPGLVLFNGQNVLSQSVGPVLESDLLSQVLSFLFEQENQRRQRGLAI